MTDTQKALDALNKLAITCDPSNETMLLVRTIRAALEAKAVDALTFVCRTLGWLEVVPPYGDAVSRTAECDKAIKLCATIRAALEAKAVPDGFVLVPIEPSDEKMQKIFNAWMSAPSDFRASYKVIIQEAAQEGK